MRNLSDAQDFVMFGIQGCGKGTHGARFCEERGYQNFVMGQTFRDMQAEQSELADTVRSYTSTGRLVPHDIVMNVVREKIGAIPFDQRIVVDGIPRNPDQMEDFNELMADLGRGVTGVHLRISKDEARRRIAGRAADEGRADDADMAIVEERFRVYEQNTVPVIEAYRAAGRLVEIDAQGEKLEVYARLIHSIARFQTQLRRATADLV